MSQIWVWVWVWVVGSAEGWISLSMWLGEGRRVLKVEMRERWGSGGVSPEAAAYWVPKME